MKLALLAALLGASACVLAQENHADQRIEDNRELPQLEQPAQQQRQSNWVDETTRPTGEAKAASSDIFSPLAPEIRQYIAELTNTALTPGALPRAAEMLCDEDRARITEQMKQVDLTEHDQIVTRFRQQWKMRYGEEFDLARERAVVAEYYVLSGLRSPEEAIIAAHRPPGQGSNGPPQRLQPPQAPDRAATMVIPPNPGEKHPAMILMLANEQTSSSGWKLNTPSSLTAERLRQNMAQRLSRFLDGQASWPADPREAYRIISYHILATFNDQPPDRAHPAPRPTPAQPDNPSLET